MWCTIFAILFSIHAASSAEDNANATQMGSRYYFGNPGGTDGCFSRKRQPGRCVPLRNCPHLKEIMDSVPPMYVLSAVSEYVCGFNNGGVQVCCPTENRNQAPRTTTLAPVTRRRPNKEPLVEAQPTRNPNWWPTLPPATRKPQKPQPTTTTTRKPQTPPLAASKPQGGQITNHRNRRLLPQECGIEVANKILGGKETSLDEYPWMALLRLRFSSGRTVFSCAGSLISPKYVLTAAHCIRNPRLPTTSVIDQVRLGEHDQDQELDCIGTQCSDEPLDVEIEERIVHPNYNPKDKSSRNDIALIRLKRAVQPTRFVKPICLPLDDLKDKDFNGEDMWTAGWGKTNNGANSQSPVKLKILLPVIPLQQCAPIYRKDDVEITDKQICAGGRKNEDSCQGDSGGPLMRQDVVGSTVRWHVQGVVSFGPETCGTANSPGIYTKVGKYLDWILDNMRD